MQKTSDGFGLNPDIAVAAAGLALAVGLIAWFHPAPAQKLAERKAVAAGRVLCLALDNWAAQHKGAYPPTQEVAGGDRDDVLISSGNIRAYPENPLRPGRAMANVPRDARSPGDFSYTRSNDKEYEYELLVHGPGKEPLFQRTPDAQ